MAFTGSVGMNGGQSIPIGVNLEEASCQNVKQQLKKFEELCSKEGSVNIKTQIDKDGYKQIKQMKDAMGNLVTQMKKFDAEGKILSNTVEKIESKNRSAGKAIDEYANAVEKLQKRNVSTSTSLKELSQGFNKVKEVSEKVVANGQSFTKTLTTLKDESGRTTRTVQTLTSETGETSSALLKESQSAEIAKKKTSELGGALEMTGNKAKSAGVGLADFRGTMVKIAEFQAINQVLNIFTSSVSDAIEVVKEFDSALTDLRKVTTVHSSELGEYARQLGELGEGVARTTTEMVQNAAMMEQAGYHGEDAKTLARVVALYQNVADSEVSAAEAGRFVASQLKAFNINAKDAESIVDKLNEVSNNYSVSNTDLAEGLRKSASALHVLGNSQDEILGMLTAGTEQLTGQASTVAKGLTSIGNNINDIAQKSKTFEITVQGATKQIQLYDEAGQQLSTFDVLNQIAQSWKDMSHEEQTATASILAKKTRFNVFTAVLSQFDDALKATKTSMTSQGSAAEENAKHMESLEAKVNGLKAQFEQLVLGQGGLQNIAKLFLDIATAMLKFANSGVGQAIIKIAMLKTAITGLTTAFNMLKASAKVTAFVETVQQIGSLTKEMGLLKGILQAFIITQTQSTTATAASTGAKVAETGATVALTEAESALNVMQEAQAGTEAASTLAHGASTGAKVAETGATTTLTMAQEALNLALKSNPIGLVITAVGALYGAYKGLTYLCEKYTDTVDSLNEESKKHSQKADEHKNKLDQLETAYQQNIDKIKELQDLQRLAPKSDYSREISNLTTSNKLLEIKMQTEQRLYDIERKRAANKAIKALNTTEDYKSFSSVNENTGELNWENKVASPKDQVKEQTAKLKELSKGYKEFVEERSKYAEDLKNIEDESDRDTAEKLDNKIKGFQEAGDKIEEQLLKNNERIIEAMEKLTDPDTGEVMEGQEKKYEQLAKLIGDADTATQDYATSVTASTGASADAAAAADGLATSQDGAKTAAEQHAEALNKLSEQLNKSVTAMGDARDACEILKGVANEYNSTGQVSYDNLKKLLNLNPKYLSALTVQNGKLKVNEKALKAQFEQEKKNILKTLEASGALKELSKKEDTTAEKTSKANKKVDIFNQTLDSTGSAASGSSSGFDIFNNNVSNVITQADKGTDAVNGLRDAIAGVNGAKITITKKETLEQEIENLDPFNPNSDLSKAYKKSKKKNNHKKTTTTSGVELAVKSSGWDSPSSSHSGGGGGGGSSRGGGGGGGSSSDKKAKEEEARRKAEEKKKKEAEKKLKEAKKATNKVIKDGIKQIDDETNAYKKNYKWQQKQLNIAKKKEKQLKGQKTTYENVKKYIDEMYDSEINKLKDLEDEFQNLVQKERDALEHDITIKDKNGNTETVKKNYVEIGRILDKAKSDLDVLADGYDRAIAKQERLQRSDQSIKSKEKEIKELEDELKEKQKINDETERGIQLQELQDALDRAKKMRVKVYKKGEGFVYDQDQDAIKEAQKNLNAFLREKEETDLQNRIDKAQEDLDALNKVYEDEIQRQEDLKQAAEDNYHAQYDDLQGWYDDTTALYDDYLDYRTEYKVHSEKLDKDITTSEVLNSKKRIENLEKEKKKFDELWDAQERKQHEKLVQELTNLKSAELGEQESYDNRIKIFEKFVSDYENLASRLEKAEKKVTKQQEKTDSAKTAYDFQKDQDKSQKEALEKIKDKTDKAKTTKEVQKNKKAAEALTEYQKAIDKSQHELYSKVKKGSMTTNQAIEEYNMWARHWYNYYKLESYGIPFTYSATGVYTQGKANMFGGKKATGDASIKKNGIYLVGDSPNQELVIGSKINGIPMNLPQGTGVVNAKSTKTFAGWLNTMGAMNKDKIGTLNKNTTNNDNFSISNVTVNGANINDGKSFANELLSLKAEMLQSAYRR